MVSWIINEISGFQTVLLELFQTEDVGRWESEFQPLLLQSEPLQENLFYILDFLLGFI